MAWTRKNPNPILLASGTIIFGCILLLLVFVSPVLTDSGLSAPSAASINPPRGPSRDRLLSQLNHASWTAKDGVPGEVLALAQTTDGYLWLGTANGLCRFDGVRFDRYQPPNGETFPSHIIETLSADPDGGLYVGFRLGGVSFIKGNSLKIYSEADGLPQTTIRSITRTWDGAIWAASNVGLFRLTGSRWEKIDTAWNYPWTAAQTLFVDRSGTLWVAGEGSIVYLPKGQKKFLPTGEHVIEMDRITQAPDGQIWVAETTNSVRPLVMGGKETRPRLGEVIVGSVGILFDDAGTLWITTLGDGIGRIRFPDQLSGRGAIPFRQAADIFSQKEGLTSDMVDPVLEDREGNIWVGTSTGLDRFRDSILVPIPLRAGSNDMILIPGDHGDIWTGSLNRTLTHIKDKSITVQKQTGEMNIACGIADRDGSLWVGGPNGIRHFVNGRLVDVPLPKGHEARSKGQAYYVSWTGAIARRGTDELWAAFPRGGVFRLSGGVWTDFDASDGLPQGVPGVLYTAPDDRLWMGYQRGALAVYDGKKFSAFGQKDGLDIGAVITVYQHGQYIWIGGEFGLELLVNGRFRHVYAADESRFRGITGIVETPEGGLWLNAVNGIVRVAATELEHAIHDPEYRMNCQQFDYLDGLPGTSAKLRARPTAVQGTDGRLWFSVANGIVWIDPAVNHTNAVPPPVYVQSVVSKGTEYSDLGNLKLPIGTTNLQIDYTALSFSVPERVMFRYRLEGVDGEWQEAGTRREAFYTNLGPGQYRLHVIACNNDGVWNDTGASLRFYIAPAFYQTNWFLLFCGVLAAMAVLAAFRWRLHYVTRRLDLQFQERLSERTRIAQELHDTLLQGVLSASMQLDVANDALPGDSAAKPMVSRVLELMRLVIEDGRNVVRGLRLSDARNENLDQALSRVPRETGLQGETDFRIIVAGSNRPLHPMIRDEVYRIGREAVVNAFRHASAKTIEVEVEYAAQQLRVQVRDDGRGIDPKVVQSGREGHWGLSGMRERAEAIGGKLRLWSSPGGGTELELKVPGKIAYEAHSSKQRFRWLARLYGRKEAAKIEKETEQQ